MSALTARNLEESQIELDLNPINRRTSLIKIHLKVEGRKKCCVKDEAQGTHKKEIETEISINHIPFQLELAEL